MTSFDSLFYLSVSLLITSLNDIITNWYNSVLAITQPQYNNKFHLFMLFEIYCY